MLLLADVCLKHASVIASLDHVLVEHLHTNSIPAAPDEVRSRQHECYNEDDP